MWTQKVASHLYCDSLCLLNFLPKSTLIVSGWNFLWNNAKINTKILKIADFHNFNTLPPTPCFTTRLIFIWFNFVTLLCLWIGSVKLFINRAILAKLFNRLSMKKFWFLNAWIFLKLDRNDDQWIYEMCLFFKNFLGEFHFLRIEVKSKNYFKIQREIKMFSIQDEAFRSLSGTN